MAYYLGSDTAEAFFHRRFRTFVGAHFGDPDPTGPVPSSPALARHVWMARINRFCDLFAAGSSSLISTPPRRTWPLAEQAFDRFLAWLYTGWASEIVLHP